MSNAAEIASDEEGGLGLGDLLAALRRRVWLILLLAAAAGAVAVALALSLPNQYEAIATVQIDPRKKTIVSLDAVLPDIAGDTPTIESQVEIIRSSAIALKVIEALGLRGDPEFGGNASPAEASAASAAADARHTASNGHARRVLGPEASAIGSDRPERDPVAAEFTSRLKAVRVRNSLVVEIIFRSRDPVKAARIANTVAEVYIRDQIDMKIQATGLAAELLGPKLDGLRAKVSDAEHRVARFKAENGIIDAEGQPLSERQLSRLMDQTVAARNSTAEARAKYEQMQTVLRGGASRNIGDVLLSQTVRMLKDEHAKSTKREAELLTRYGALHPEIAKVRAEVADIERQISRETDQIIANIKNELAVAVDRERMLETSLSQLKDQQTITKEVTVTLRDLEREAETSRRVLEAFLARYKQTVESQELHLPDARIVERATVSFDPVSPKRRQIVLIGLLAGLGLGIGLALALELTRTGLSRAEEAQSLLGVPLLASVPTLQRRLDGLADPVRSLRFVLARPDGTFARSIAMLRKRLDHQRSDSGPRVVLVTASLPNEGTTVVAANLALAIARHGGRTLLIDADLRRSRFTHHMGLDQAPGLADAVGFGQDFEQMILKDTSSGLTVIPAGDVGRYPMSPQEALAAPGFAQRLARLKTHFDTIIIDAPPLLPVVDARILAGYADQILLVAAWRKTPKDIIRKAVRLLGGNAALLSGVILNQVDPTTLGLAADAPPRARRTIPTVPPRRAA